MWLGIGRGCNKPGSDAIAFVVDIPHIPSQIEQFAPSYPASTNLRLFEDKFSVRHYDHQGRYCGIRALILRNPNSDEVYFWGKRISLVN